jgi:LPS-assembly protein
VMRQACTPHEGCGTSRERPLHRKMERASRACSLVLMCLATCAAAALTLARPASAQDPSVTGSPAGPISSFTKTPGGMFGNIKRKVDTTKPMNVQGDQLIYDTNGNRVIARGNVEIYYNDYILTADEVIYDQNAGTLTAVGNVTLKEPQGNIIRADRYTLTDDFRDGFVQSLSIVTKDDTRISADRAIRRDGNVTEFRNGRFTPCKSDGGTPPLWCLSAANIIHDKAAATITYQDAYFEVFGQPIIYLPYFQHADPSVRISRSGIRSVLQSRIHHRHPLLFRPRSELRLHLQSPLPDEAGRALARRMAAPSCQRPVHHQSRRHRSKCE